MKEGESRLPRHIAFIMDGNGRWAQQHGVPRIEGHRAGSKTMEKISNYCIELGIPYVTFYAFSTENWKRPQQEVAALMNLLKGYLNDLEKRSNNDARLVILGDLDPLDKDIRDKALLMEKRTAGNKKITVNIAFNYGGRDEIVHAVRAVGRRIVAGELAPEDIDEAVMSRWMYTGGQPDPDMIIRPSGEMRLSNFLLWQAAYAELVFLDTLWPDFDKKHLDQALEEYYRRDRRFGGRQNLPVG